MSKGRILVIDDEARFREPLKQYFEGLGYTVDTASAYIPAGELIDQTIYALIVSDNKIPIRDGLRFLQNGGIQILARARHGLNEKTPFILNTGDDSQKTKDVVARLSGVYRHKDDKTPAKRLFKKLLGA